MKVAPLFKAKGLEFRVEYVNSVRDWQAELPNISTLYGAYRRRSIRDQDIVPHSFTFIRRESALASLNKLSVLCQLFLVRSTDYFPWCFPQNRMLLHSWGMPASLLQGAEERLPSWYTPDGSDVFVLIKAYVSDQDLSQPPLLALPGCKMQDVSAALAQLAEQNAKCNLNWISLNQKSKIPISSQSWLARTGRYFLYNNDWIKYTYF